MEYVKKEFKAGDILSALDLNNIGDGIEEAIGLAQEGAAGAANMEKGTGENATEQLPRADKVTQAEGEDTPHFSFTGHPDAGMQGRIQYGAVGNYSASMNGRSAALNKHAFAINNSTVAKGEESFAQGYETIAEGNSSFAGGSKTWAKGAASVALGDRTKATGDYSFANGVKTVAGYNYQTVVGVGNDNNVESLFEVGNAELDVDGNVIEPSTAFRVMRNGKVKIKDIWAKEDDDVVALGFLNHHLNNELLPQLGEAISAELDTFRPYLVLTSDREDKTSVQMAACQASGAHSAAFGHTANTFSAYTCAIGKNVSASGDHSIVMGVNSHTGATAAFAVGVNANANGAHSRALGTNVNAGYVYQTVIGKDNLNKEGTLFEIGGGNGVEGDEREKWNVFEVYNDGLIAVGNRVQQMPEEKYKDGLDFTGRNDNAISLDPTLTSNGVLPYGAIGEYSTSFGCSSVALGKKAMAINNKTVAKGDESFAAGYQCVALGAGSTAMGSKTVSKGDTSMAVGNNTIALGNTSFAEGSLTIAEGEASHAEGWETHAVGNYSHSEGQKTVAQGLYSHAEGYMTNAEGEASHAAGRNTIAQGNHSYAGGYNTKATASEQFVIGRWNELKQDALFIVGAGSSEAERKNVFEVWWTGDAYVNGEKVMTKANRYAHYITNLTSDSDNITEYDGVVIYSNRETPYASWGEIENDVKRGASMWCNYGNNTAWKKIQGFSTSGYDFGDGIIFRKSSPEATPADTVVKE